MSEEELPGQESWRPARETKSQRNWTPGQFKKRRSLRTMFSSVVLTFEAIVLFFVALTIFNLNRDADWAWWVLGGTLSLAGLCIATCAWLRHPVGYGIGWGIQVLFLALGFIEPMVFLASIGFVAAWAYAVIKGRTLDRENAERDAAEEEYRRTHPE